MFNVMRLCKRNNIRQILASEIQYQLCSTTVYAVLIYEDVDHVLDVRTVNKWSGVNRAIFVSKMLWSMTVALSFYLSILLE